MQVLLAGSHKMLYLEMERDVVHEVCKQLGLDVEIRDGRRSMVLDITAPGRQAPLLLFDAREPGNLGWFARCQFYVDGQTGSVLQTPITVANLREPTGRIHPGGIRLSVSKELPSSFKLPGRQPVSEKLVYGVLFNFLSALVETGVALCGGPVVRPLAGRGDTYGPKA